MDASGIQPHPNILAKIKRTMDFYDIISSSPHAKAFRECLPVYWLPLGKLI